VLQLSDANAISIDVWLVEWTLKCVALSVLVRLVKSVSNNVAFSRHTIIDFVIAVLSQRVRLDLEQWRVANLKQLIIELHWIANSQAHTNKLCCVVLLVIGQGERIFEPQLLRVFIRKRNCQ